MKDYIEKNLPEKLSYDQLCSAGIEAWLTIPPSELKELVHSIRDRC